MLIPGGLGETEESKEIAARMIERIREAHGKGDGGPVFLGANCMGVISRPAIMTRGSSGRKTAGRAPDVVAAYRHREPRAGHSCSTASVRLRK